MAMILFLKELMPVVYTYKCLIFIFAENFIEIFDFLEIGWVNIN